MNFDEFKAFLDENAVDYKDGSQRILLKECFECGYRHYKTSFRPNDKGDSRVLWGKCFRCNESFSSYRYLVDLGLSVESVKRLHAFDNLSEANAKADFVDLLFQEDKILAAAKPDDYHPRGVSINGFFKISSWPDHPVSKYALKRGVPEGLYKHVMIDTVTQSVVFLCWEKDRLVGWQKRFYIPPRPNYKTQNPPADQFKKSMHVIEYENEGPIAVCEGPFSGVSAWVFGYHAIVTFGSAVSKPQMQKIEEVAKRTGKSIYVSFDLDPAGFRGFFKIKNYFERRGIVVKRIEPESGNDLNDAWQDHKRERIIENDPYDSSVPVLDMFADIYKG